jgi:hypothetical protein
LSLQESDERWAQAAIVAMTRTRTFGAGTAMVPADSPFSLERARERYYGVWESTQPPASDAGSNDRASRLTSAA